MAEEKISYNFKEIESKWQKVWQQNKTFATKSDSSQPKFYALEMFPYPSGRIHMGHVRNYVIGDIIAHYKRLRGYNVMHPVGWDGFGMPAENAAIKNNIHPDKWTWSNIDYMRGQLKQLGLSYDWDREIATCSPEYYKWNQWFFIQFYKKGLAYRKKSAVNWCPSCKTVLANEQVENGECWRCDSKVEQKELEQWFFRTRDYAKELLKEIDWLKQGWPERVLAMQKNWIGESLGAEVEFVVDDPQKTKIKIFTTRPDTLFGATFMVLSPGHPLVVEWSQNNPELAGFIKNVKMRQSPEEETEKEGFFTGYHAINPVNNQKIPVWTANYVLMGYGTGAIMAVPAHDQRDFEFAVKYKLPIIEVIKPVNEQDKTLPESAFEGDGIMVNSGEFNGLPIIEGTKKVCNWLENKELGKKTIEYKLRDWLISRQRYWGTPIPVIYCPKCGIVTVPEEELPVLLPKENVQFTGIGESPLTKVENFVNTTCPLCGGKAKRETDTMDTFVDSSWYYLRYCDPKNDKQPFSKDKVQDWVPVHQYVGGIEHACMHLIYSRFFHKVVRDLGLIECDEPFARLLTQGMVTLGGSAMSKSRGNVVEPQSVIDNYGVDTLRVFVLFAAPPDKDMEWSDAGIEGSFRFVGRVYRLVHQFIEHNFVSQKNVPASEKELLRILHLTIKRVTDDIGNKYQFNTALAAIMELVNFMYQYPALGDKLSYEVIDKLVILLYPFTPHMCSELWSNLGYEESIESVAWPGYNAEYILEDEIEIPVQVNGKIRSRIKIKSDATKEEIKQVVIIDPKVEIYLKNKIVKDTIYVQKKLINFVVE